MIYRILLLLVVIFCGHISMQAQQIKKVSIEYTYHAPQHISPMDAKQIAVERAKLQAIADEFGTVIQSTNTTLVGNNNGKSTIDMFAYSESEVKGEWIETIGEPEYLSMTYEQDMLVVKVKVVGRIREIVSAAVDIKAKILRNGVDDKFESDEFCSGDDLYLSFQTPQDGYLAVYLVDAAHTAYCLLPYRSQRDGIYQVAANTPYIFFSAKNVPASQAHMVDEYMMTADKALENNQIYIIYSPNHFSKAIDTVGSDALPRELSLGDFLKWLSDCRKSDKDMQVERKSILVQKK